MFIVLFLVVYLLRIYFKWAKTVRLQEPSAPFCGILNELTKMVADKQHDAPLVLFHFKSNKDSSMQTTQTLSLCTDRGKSTCQWEAAVRLWPLLRWGQQGSGS